MAGLCLSFVTFGIVVATIGHSIGLTEQMLVCTSAVLMIGFDLVLLVPRINQFFATATASVGAGADGVLSSVQSTNGSTLRTQFIGGVLLGAVCSPCIGPTLGGAISLTSQGRDRDGRS